ncbi:MAG: hypothetical protein FWG45_03800 [Oscillospiraceae bacterium]|nr:hypothetical protein [Oscillospiraceae bacterium]
MNMVYIALLVLSAIGLAADVVLRYVEKIKCFGLEGKLFKKTYDTIPLEKLLPENVTMLLITVMTAAAAGVIVNALGVPWYVSPFCAVSSGLILCFAVQYYAVNAIDAVRGNALPKGEAAAGLNGYCTVAFDEGFGKVMLAHKEREFEVNAGLVKETGEGENPEKSQIEQHDRIIALYESDGYYFVVKIGEIYTGIDTKF